MHASEILNFIKRERLAVVSSISPAGWPQAAVVGVAVSDEFEIVFDTLGETRKARNLRVDNRVALVVGGLNDGDERTVQCEGYADEPTGDELTRLREVYFAAYPDGRARLSWPGITHFRFRPTWLRFTDFNVRPPLLVELAGPQLSEAARRLHGTTQRTT